MSSPYTTYITKLYNAIVNKINTAVSNHDDDNTAHSDIRNSINNLSTVATSGDYDDLTNKPTIPSQITVDSSLSTTSTNPVQNKVVKSALDSKANSNSLATVATSGSYEDLSNKPTIPEGATVDSELSSTSTNPVQNKVVKSALDGKANSSSLATVATSGSYNDLSNKPTIPEGATVDSELSSTSTNAVQNKVIKSALDGKSDSGHTHNYAASSHTHSTSQITDFPTIPSVDSSLSTTSTNAVQNKVVKSALDGKSDTSHTHNYAASSHSHSISNITNLQSSLNGKSDTSHTHSGYASSSHTHSKSQITDFPSIPSVDSSLSTTSTNAIQNKAVSTALNGKSDSGHTHSGYANSSHSHTTSDISNFPSIPSVDSSLSTTSTNTIQNKVVTGALNGKSDSGHTHSGYAASDHTHSGYAASSHTHSKSQITDFPTIPSVDSTLSTTSTNAIQNKAVATALNGKSDTSHTHNYAASSHTHSKSQITDFPTIPSKTSDLTNDSGFLTSHLTVDSSLSTTSTNPVQNKVVNSALDGKASRGHTHDYAASSHTHSTSQITDFPSIPSKTSDLTNDSGFLTSHLSVDGLLSTTSTNPVQNKVVKSALDNKSDTSHTHNYAASSHTHDYAASNHSHNSWTAVSVSYGSFYVNTALQIAELFYNQGNFSNTTGWANATGSIPSGYRPTNDIYTIGSNFNTMALVRTSGVISGLHSKSGITGLTFHAVWHY